MSRRPLDTVAILLVAGLSFAVPKDGWSKEDSQAQSAQETLRHIEEMKAMSLPMSAETKARLDDKLDQWAGQLAMGINPRWIAEANNQANEMYRLLNGVASTESAERIGQLINTEPRGINPGPEEDSHEGNPADVPREPLQEQTREDMRSEGFRSGDMGREPNRDKEQSGDKCGDSYSGPCM